MQIIVRELEKSAITITPKHIFMEGDTVLTQYIVPKWSLKYINESKNKFVNGVIADLTVMKGGGGGGRRN